jgi:alpha-beta hydrolase superfamily lysophospholipase
VRAPTQLDVDITGVVLDGEPLSTSVLVALPDELDDAPLVCLFPGGTVSKRYFHLEIPGHAGYSMIEHLAARGYIAAACDHLGVGDSSHPEPDRLTLDVLGAANDATARALLRLLAQGDVEGAPAMTPRFVLGAGQSMGGCLLIVQQASHATFDAVAVLGYSAIHTHAPGTGPHLDPHTGDLPPATSATADPSPDYPEGIPPGYGWSGRPRTREGYAVFMRSASFWGNNWEDVELDVAFPASLQWRSTTPPVATTMLQPGIVSRYAAAITSPVLAAMGERDVVADAHAEATAYGASRDVSIFVVPRMGHNHNLATTRHLLWDRVADWGLLVAG